MTAPSTDTILVSRFPGSVTPGALPMLPNAVSIGVAWQGGFIVYRWFEGGGEYLDQSAPEFHETLADACARVPAGYDVGPAPEGFAALLVYRRRLGT